LGQALERGIGFGAHFEELFADDADDTVSAPVLSDAVKQLTGTVPKGYTETVSPRRGPR
jgi:hypothetical protein